MLNTDYFPIFPLHEILEEARSETRKAQVNYSKWPLMNVEGPLK